MRVKLVLLSILLSGNFLFSETKLKYNFSYFLKGNAKGHVLFIIPFRIFYQSFASVDFSAERDGKKLRFISTDIPEPGHMMRTLGFSGRSFALLVASANRKKGKELSKQLLGDLTSVIPGFGKYIKKKYNNLFSIPSSQKNKIFFYRSEDGISATSYSGLRLKRLNSGKIIKINFNIYKIMMEVVKAYNHSYLPRDLELSDLILIKKKTWFSKNVDFSTLLTRSARFAARIFTKIRPLNQDKPFSIKYSILKSDNNFLILRGEAFPGVKIWHSIKVRSYIRDIIIRKRDLVLTKDSFTVKVTDKKGRGGFINATLKLLNDKI
ncbi:MAG: hypothetical protein ABFR75_08800 [Acidobacteriota bacterium]